MSLFDFVVLVFASRALQRAWSEGSLFTSWRARAETWDNFLGELLGCPFCLSYHVPWLVLVALYAPAQLVGAWWGWLPRGLWYAWGAAGVNHFLVSLWELNHAGVQEHPPPGGPLPP